MADEAIIGSIGVAVVPDARAFWDAFKAKTQAGADSAAPTVPVHADTDQAQASIAELRAKISAASASITINTDTRGSAGQIATLTAAVNRLEDAQGATAKAQRSLAELQATGDVPAQRLAAAQDAVTRAQRDETLSALRLAAAQETVGAAQSRAAERAAQAAAKQTESQSQSQDSAKKSNDQLKLLQTTLVTLGPAAVPVGAVVVGALAGAIPVAATLALGFKGIADQAKSGELALGPFGDSLKVVQQEAQTLKQTAAAGLLGGLNQAIQTSQPLFGALNQDIAVMSGQLGQIVAGVGPALLSILQALNPLFVEFGQLLATGAGKLENWATSSHGISSFVAYVQAELPQVMQLLGNLVVIVGHLIEAFAPIGEVVLRVLVAVSSVIAAIPINILTDLSEALIALYVANRVATGFNLLAGAVAKMGSTGGLAAVGIAALAVGVYELGKHINAAIEGNDTFGKVLGDSKNTIQTFTSVLEQSNGKLDANARAAVTAALQQDGLAAKAAKAGVSLKDLTDGVAGTNAQFIEMARHLKDGGASDRTIASLAILHGQYLQAADAATKFAQAQLQALQEQLGGTSAINDAAAALGVTSDQYLAVAQATGKATDQAVTNAATQRLQSAALREVASQLVATKTGFDTATLSGDAFAAAVQAFSTSAGTAADHAALLGAGLVAMQGDALGVAGALSSAAASNLALTGAFTQQAQQAVAAGQAVSQAVLQQQSAEDSLAQAQQGELDAQKALTNARVAAKVALEDLNNQIIDGSLSQRRAVIDLKAAQQAYKATPNASTKLSLDEATQRLAEIELQNKRLAEQKKQSDKAGIEGSTQVAAAQKQVEQANKAAVNAQRQLAAAATSVSDALRQQAASFDLSEKAAINLKTGAIDYTKAGAAPLVGQLQAMQDAAEKAAEAMYQHEYHTKGAGKAAQDAAAIFKGDTYNALIKDADQLGITSGEAKKLADRYFNMPKSFSTQAKLLGTEDVITVLNQIGTQLSLLTKHPWVSTVDADTLPLDTKLLKAQAKLNALAALKVTIAAGGSGKGFTFISGVEADGGVLDFANRGAKVSHFADGAHVAQIAPAGAYRVWAEEETGGEAYIPLAESKRTRSEDILSAVADRFGGRYSRGEGGSRSLTYAPINNYYSVAPPPLPRPSELRRLQNRLG